MVRSNNVEKTIIFKVQKDDNVLATPTWRKVEAENADCPVCGQLMAVVIGANMYGYCPRCQCYYLADEEEKDEGSHSQEG